MNKVTVAVVIAVLAVIQSSALAETGKQCVYDAISQAATVKHDVKYATYDQLVALKDSGEAFVLVDVLAKGSYDNGHIEGAISFPVNEINEESAKGVFNEDSKIVVYCGSFLCTASTSAAEKLGSMGYSVLDYKGGLKEWQSKGNALVK